MKISLIAFVIGIIFALGLGVSEMTRPDVVQGFLDIFGEWKPNLLFVMIGAILVYASGYQLIKKRKSPLFTNKFILPVKKSIDKKLVIGAALFGLGWGIAGICPGPGIVSLVSGNVEILIFVISMIIGMKAFHFIENKI